MANINVVKRLEKLEREIEAIAKYIAHYHGVPTDEAREIAMSAQGIKDVAAEIERTARWRAGGSRR